MTKSPFPLYDTIEGLRINEEILITANISKIDEDDAHETVLMLQKEYDLEKANYPFSPPEFDSKAALWSCKVIYYAAQLLVNRTNTNKKLDDIVPMYAQPIDASAILSVDLCLRFLPYFISEFRYIDPNDPIIERLMKISEQFHYSAIGQDLDLDKLDFEPILQNNCLKQLYLDRIVERKAIHYAKLECIEPLLHQNFGNYKSHFWKEL